MLKLLESVLKLLVSMLNIKYEQVCSKAGMHNSDFMAGQKMLLKYLRARLVKFFLILLVFPSKIKPNMHIFGLCGPD